MEIRLRAQRSGPVLAAVCALIVLGVGSLYLTWQSIQHQREVVEDHMVLSGSVIARGIEGNLLRMVRGLRGSPVLADRIKELVGEYLQEVTDSDEIAFVALYGPDGKLLLGSRHEGEALNEAMPEQARRDILRGGSWHGMTTFLSRSVLVVGLSGRPGLARVCGMGGQNMPQGMGWGQGRGHGQGMHRGNHEANGHAPDDDFGPGQGQGQGPGRFRPNEEPPLFFFVGLDAERHLAQFQLFRRAALLQTGYVFGAAVVLWLLAFAYLRRRTEAHRADRMERFQSKLLDNMPDGLVTLSDSGEIMAANPSAMRLLHPEGGGPEIAVGDGSRDDCPQNDSPPNNCPIDGCVVGRNWAEFPFGDAAAPMSWQQYEYFGRRLEILCVPFRDDEKDDEQSGDCSRSDESRPRESRLVLLRDRTQLRSLEDDLEEAKRLATIGSLAAGVAHEVRNPLSSLRGFAQFFADKFKDKKPYDDYAATMVKEADRLNRVVTDLLYLARPRQVNAETLFLDEALNGLEKLMRFDLEGKGVALEKDLRAAEVHADADALTQVLLNLIANALDAVPAEGGRIRVSSRQGADGVRVTVEDNGPGIGADQREQALEPFFTTKNKGTGLGLAIVNTILRAHRGRVAILESELGGAALELLFPNATPMGTQSSEEPDNRR